MERKVNFSLKHRMLSLLVTAVMMLVAQSAWAGLTYQVIAGDRNNEDNEGLPKLFDGDYGTKWGNGFSEGQPQYFIIKVSEAIAPEWYTLVTGTDNAAWNHRNWKSWSIYGANFVSDEEASRDAAAWVQIDHKENISEAYLPDKNSYEVPFGMEKPSEAYLYFKVEIEAMMSGGGYMQMTEFFFNEDNSLFASRTAEMEKEFAGYAFPEYFQYSLKDAYTNRKTGYKGIQYAETFDEMYTMFTRSIALQEQIEASAEAYQAYINTVNSVAGAAEAGKLNAEGTAKVAAYTSEEEIAPSDVPQAAGRWTFDDPSNLLAGTGVSTLTAVKNGDVTTPVDPATIGIVPVAGPTESNGAVAVPVQSYFRMATQTGADQTPSYSILFDVMSEGFGSYTSLLQCDPTNTKDASLFFKKNQLGRGGVFGYSGDYQTNTWYRVILTYDDGKAELYVDGEKIADNGSNIDYTKQLFTMGKEALLFADEDGEETLINVSEIRFFDKTLSADEAKKLGGVGEGEPAEFPNGNCTFILNNGLLSAGAISAEAKTVSTWPEIYSSVDLTEGAIDVTYTALSGVDGFGDAEHYSKLVDGDDYTKWCSGNGDYYIIIKTSEPVAATYYRLFTSGDTGSYPDRNWKTWQIFGANFASDDAATRDAEGWTLIENKENSNAIPAASNTEVNIFLSNPSATPYQYYKIEIKNPTGVMQMSEFKLFNQANFYKNRQDAVAEFEAVDITSPTQKSLIPEFQAAIAEVAAATTLDGLATAYTKAADLRNQVVNATEAYAALTEIVASIGDDAPETIKKYASEKSAPGEAFANGSYPYIIEAQELSADKVNAEINYVKAYLNPVNGYIVLSGNTAWGDGENWTKLIDGDLTTKWGGGRPAEGSYLIFKAVTALAPYYYTLVTGNDTGNSPDRNWADWTIYAANFENDAQATRDNVEWIAITKEEGIGQDRLPGGNFIHANFDFKPAVATEYTYFRVEVPKSYNNGGNIQMTELIFKSAEDFAALKAETINELKAKLTEMGADPDAMIANNSYINGAVSDIEAATTVEGILAGVAKAEQYLKVLKAPDMVNGYYQIGTPEQLQWLAGAVKMGFQSAKVQLTADLDMGGTLVDGAPAEDSKLFTPIGITDIPFTGEFDGQGHVISNLVINTGENYSGLFGRIAGSAIIKNFIIDAGSYIGGNSYVGVIGASQGGSGIIIDRIGMEGTVVAAEINAGGIYGCNMGNPTATISNCYVTGAVTGKDQAGQMNGWLGGGKIENSWAIGAIEGVYNKTPGAGDGFYRGGANVGGVNYSNAEFRNATVSEFNADDAKSGAMTYALNGNKADGAWFQTLGEDELPTLNATHKKVYAKPEAFRCDGMPLGEVAYTNDEVIPELPAHEYDGYICKNCGGVDPNVVAPENGVYPLSNAYELAWFSAMVNSGNTNINAKLVDDIDMTNATDFKPIGTQTSIYKGTFDGQFYTIKNFTIEGGDYTGLFGVITGGAVIKNFIVDANSTISGNAFVAVIGGSNGGGDILIENIGMEGKVTAAAQNAGGIYGVNMGGAAHPVIKNCYVCGPVIGNREAGQITGYAGGGEAINLLAIGEIQGYYFEDMNDAMLRGNPASTNCYSTVPDKNATVITPEQLASGELTWLLNGGEEGVWKQTLGVDEHPILYPDHASVVKVGDSYMNKVGDALQIASAADLNNFATAVNGGAAMNAELVNNIDFADITPITIGTVENPFRGKFDGKGFTINNFSLEANNADGGLFGQVIDAEICNFEIWGTMTVHAARNGVVAFAKGSSYIHHINSNLNINALEGGTITHTAGVVGDAQESTFVEYCSYGGNLFVGNYNDCFAGIVGYTNTARVENCLYYGVINFAANNGYVGGIVGYINNTSNPGIANCLSVGTVLYTGDGNPQFGGAIVGRLRSWNTETMGINFWMQGSAYGGSGENTEDKFVCVSADELASGKIAAALGDDFRQNIGEDAYPMLDPTRGIVREITEAGYATMYIHDITVEIPAGVSAFTGLIQNEMLVLMPLQNIIMKNQAVVLKGAAGYYSFKPTEVGVGTVQSDLLGAEEDIEADGSQYVLAKKDDVIGFYKAEGTIAAGKAYLLGGANVKGFALSFDGVTAISEAIAEKTVENDAIYDLSGRRVEKATKGIYIINGKKVLK